MKLFNLNGEMSIIIEALLFSLFSVLTKLVMGEISAVATIVITWIFAGGLFVGLLFYHRQWHTWREFSEERFNIIVAGMIVGILFHGLFFYGIQYTTAGKAALIGITEIVFSYLLFSVWKKEREKALHLTGAMLIVGGIVIAFWEDVSTFQINQGDLSIMLAFAIVPLGNFFQQKSARRGVPVPMILLVRTVLILICFSPLLWVMKSLPTWEALLDNLVGLFFIGFFILGISKILWIRGISLISVHKAISIGSIYPVFSLLFAYLLLGEIPSVYQIIALLPMGIGVYLLVLK